MLANLREEISRGWGRGGWEAFGTGANGVPGACGWGEVNGAGTWQLCHIQAPFPGQNGAALVCLYLHLLLIYGSDPTSLRVRGKLYLCPVVAQ